MMVAKKLNIFLSCALSFYFTSSHCGSIYDLSVEDYQGNNVSLDKYKGTVTLIVNVASLCGYTDAMYRGITRIHDILSFDKYFSVLAFPCNQFGEQEPNEAAVIYSAVFDQYAIEFPFFNKIDVKGPNQSPLYKMLIEQSSVAPDWNFYKYLVNHKGEVLKAWGTTTTMEEIFDDVQTAINDAKTAESVSHETSNHESAEKEEYLSDYIEGEEKKQEHLFNSVGDEKDEL